MKKNSTQLEKKKKKNLTFVEKKKLNSCVVNWSPESTE